MICFACNYPLSDFGAIPFRATTALKEVCGLERELSLTTGVNARYGLGEPAGFGLGFLADPLN